MSKNGKILSVNGGDKLIESMLATAGIDQPEIVEASKAEMEKQFGSQALSNSFEQMTYVYPDSPVEIGSEWTNSYHGDLSVQNNWKLDSVTDDSINISGMANTKMSTIDENISMTLLGSQKTTIIADSKTGLFKEIVITGENSGDTLYSKQNFSVPTVIKSTITYKTSN